MAQGNEKAIDASRMSLPELGNWYREHLEEAVLPFWLGDRSDRRYGGVLNCVDNVSGERVSDDKFVWSQGRFAWLMAHASRMARQGLLSADPDDLAARAVETVEFLRKNAFLESGAAAYLLTVDGRKKEFYPGKGHDLSYFTDCFIALGLSETGRATGRWEYLEEAVEVYGRVMKRLSGGTARSEPYPLPAGCKAHAEPMILLNVAQELELASRERGSAEVERLAADAARFSSSILGDFVRADGLVQEVLCEAGGKSLLTTHLTPGHAIESMWFVIEEAARHGRHGQIASAAHVIARSFEAGWDREAGGLFRYVSPEGGAPVGDPVGPFEELIANSWSTKIWWPHSETLYATLLAHALTGDGNMRRLHDKAFDYTFSTFPNPEPSVGEWIQIRDRQGRPLQQVVGLPVKDPYHLVRNLMLLVELLLGGLESRVARA